MKYFSMFSGLGGFEIGIQNAYRSKNRTVKKDTSGNDAAGIGLVSERGEGTCPTQGQCGEHINNSEGGCEPTCVGYSEIYGPAISIYRKHFPNHINYGDATTIDPTKLPDFNLLVAGFPCQPFSLCGKRLGFEDTRGTLFHDIARIAKIKRPQYLLLENVRGILSHDFGRTFAILLSTLDEIGFDAEWELLNSKYFGVPQNRERVYIIGHLRGKPSRQIFPIGNCRQEDNEERGTYSYAIDSSYYKGAGNKKQRTLIELTKNKPDAQRIYDTAGIAKTLKGEGGGQGAKTGLYMGTLTEALGTRQGSSKEFINSVEQIQKSTGQIRRLTPTECERLQAFEDGWTKYGHDGKEMSDTTRYRCLGNAITTTVVEEIMKKILWESS